MAGITHEAKGWIDIENEVTPAAHTDLKKGMTLTFNYEGSPIHMKIMHITKTKFWVKQINLYKENEVNITDNKTGKVIG